MPWPHARRTIAQGGKSLNRLEIRVIKSPTIVEVDVEEGQRLDNFLIARLKGLPKSRIYRMVRRGEVRVNGSRARVGYRVQRGDKVRVPPYRVDPEPEEPSTGPSRHVYTALLETAVYQDDDVIVLDKPSGLAVHGGSGIAFGVVETLRGFEPRASYELVHRIDRDTSGCLVLAKNRRTLLALHTQFREGAVRKRYDLVVTGHWPDGTRVVDKPLARYALPNGERRVRISADGEPARTDFSVEGRLDEATWLAAHPKTGRTHQIRVHAAAAGHPVLGDDKYAHGKARSHSRLMLHASELLLTIGGKRTRFKAPLPREFDGLGVVAR